MPNYKKVGLLFTKLDMLSRLRYQKRTKPPIILSLFGGGQANADISSAVEG